MQNGGLIIFEKKMKWGKSVICVTQPGWRAKNRQISIKVAIKWFHKKNEWCWHLYKNCLKMEGDLGKLIVAKGLEKLPKVE